MPKRGFTNIFRSDYEIVNVDALNRFTAGTEVTPEIVYSAGLAKDRLPLKILGKGKLEHKLTVVVHKFSKSAKELIEKAGGSWKEI